MKYEVGSQKDLKEGKFEERDAVKVKSKNAKIKMLTAEYAFSLHYPAKNTVTCYWCFLLFTFAFLICRVEFMQQKSATQQAMPVALQLGNKK